MKKIVLGFIFILSMLALASCDIISFEITDNTGDTTINEGKTKDDKNSYSVKFIYIDVDGTQKEIVSTVESGLTVSAPKLEKEGATLAGWYTDLTGTNKFDFETKIKKDITLYAVMVSGYKVTYVTNGGSSIKDLYVEPGVAIQKAPTTTKEGYKLAGWFEDEALTKAYDFDEPVLSELTLYAKWELIKTHTITFNSNGGSNIEALSIQNGEKVESLEVPTKDNYNFKGWFIDEALKERFDFQKAITNDLTLYAKWEIITYKVEFDTNGGSNVVSLEINSGSKVTSPENPTKENNEFKGWFKDATLKEEFDFDTKITSDLKLYAKWEIKKCEIKFDSVGGTNVNSVIVESGKTVSKPSDPTKTDKVFAGWYLDSNYNKSYDFNSKVIDDLTLYAKWVIVKNLNVYDIPKMMDVDQEVKLSVSTYPTKYASKAVFSSSNPKIATISNDGVIKALKEGTVRISVFCEDNYKQFDIKVTSKYYLKDISINEVFFYRMSTPNYPSAKEIDTELRKKFETNADYVTLKSTILRDEYAAQKLIKVKYELKKNGTVRDTVEVSYVIISYNFNPNRTFDNTDNKCLFPIIDADGNYEREVKDGYLYLKLFVYNDGSTQQKFDGLYIELYNASSTKVVARMEDKNYKKTINSYEYYIDTFIFTTGDFTDAMKDLTKGIKYNYGQPWKN